MAVLKMLYYTAKSDIFKETPY